MIVTFYSYKGGVGRSMAMANVADVIARRGARVLMIDFDLEAPGLEQYFKVPQASARRHEGLIDLLSGFKAAMSVASGAAADDGFRDLDRFIFPVYERLPGGGRLDLMPAGSREDAAQLDRYAHAVRTFDWQDFFFNWEGELFFEWLRSSLAPERYDLVLVDSRTGVTEMGGICAYQLGDVIVMMCAANRQNVRGTQEVAADFLSSRVLALRRDRPPKLVLVPARVEQRSPELLDPFIAEFTERFGAYLPQELRDHGIGYGDLMVPYEPQYAFEERVVSDPNQPAVRAEIGAAFARLADAVTLLAPAESAIARIAAERRVERSAQFDPTARFAGYDAYLFAATEDRYHVQQLVEALTRRGLRVFADFVAAVPGPEWNARTERMLHVSRACLVVPPRELTSARRDALEWIVRAARVVRWIPVVPIALDGDVERAADPMLAGLDWVRLDDWPLDDAAIARLVERLLPSEGAAPSDLANFGAAPGSAVPSDVPPTRPTRRMAAAPGPFPSDAFANAPVPFPSAPSAAVDPFATPAPVAPAPSAAPAGRPGEATSSGGAGRRSRPEAVRMAEANPYRGMDPFAEEDAADFFGRDAVLAQAMAATLGRILWIVGPSGSGRTSLALAGVVPSLRRSGRFGAIVTLAVAPGCLSPIEASVGAGNTAALRHALVLDDIDRLLDPAFPDAERKAIVRLLARLPVDHPGCFALLVAREDRLAELLRGDLSAINVGQAQVGEVRLSHVAGDELRDIIGRPAERAGLAFEPGLIDRIVKDAGSHCTMLPVIGSVLAALWRQRRDGFLTNAAYDAAGGLRGTTLDLATRALSRAPGGEAGALALLGRLVTLAESGSQHARRRALRSELLHSGTTASARDAVIEHFVSGRTLVACANADGEPALELIHDALATHWTTLVDHIAQDQEFLAWRQSLGGYRADWIANQRDDRALLSGALREAAEGWLDRRRSDLHAAEIDYIAASERNDRANRRMKFIVLAFWLALIGGVFGWNAWKDAARDRAVDAATRAVASGDAAADRGDLESAVRSYTDALRDYPDRQALLAKRAAVHARAKDIDAALDDYNQALKADPRAVKIQLQVAELYAGQRRLPEAEAAYTRALAITPDDPGALVARGIVRGQQGRPAEAIADLSAALAIEPGLTAALFERGRLYQQQNDRENAIRDFERLLEVSYAESDRNAARARLQALGALSESPAIPAQSTRVYVQIVDPQDRRLVEQLLGDIRRANTYRFEGIEARPDARTQGDVRYVAGDQKAASELRSTVEQALGRLGYRVRLELIALDPKRFPKAATGTLELWLPPLAQASLGTDVRQLAR